MSTARVGRDYDRWVGRSAVGRMYGLLAGVPGVILVNTPVFNLHTELQLRPENRLLDIGCGTGALLQVLSSRVSFATPPVGVDLSRVMLGLARPEQRHPELLQASGLALPFHDETFDIVTCAHVVKHLDDQSLRTFLAEVRRVLSPGGIALIWEFAPVKPRLLNAWNEFVLTLGIRECNLRGYSSLRSFAQEAGFEWIANARLRPFLYPPIPRVSLIAGKAPPQWVEHS